MSATETYLVLYPDGSTRILACDRSQLNYEIRDAIGCELYEIVRTPYAFLMLVDESGVVSGRQVLNRYASAFYAGAEHGSYIFGPVVFACEGMVDGEPDIVPVPERLLSKIRCCIDQMIYS